ncbi:MAG: protein-export chaperone SecB [Thermodesulfobacteriota bacterium]
MSDQNTETAQNAPIFRLQKMYVKDLSFENPNSPDIYLEKGEPQVELNLALKHRRIDTPDHYEVTLAITAKVKNSQNDKTLFIVEIEHAGVFLLKNIPEEHIAPVLSVECATLLFPFTRQIVSQASVDGGFIPFLLEPINFLAMYENAKRQQAQNQNAQQ